MFSHEHNNSRVASEPEHGLAAASTTTNASASQSATLPPPSTSPPNLHVAAINIDDDDDMSIDRNPPPLASTTHDSEASDEDEDGEEEYHSFESSDSDDNNNDNDENENENDGGGKGKGRKSEDERRAEAEARELERLRVLEAAGLLVSGHDAASANSPGAGAAAGGGGGEPGPSTLVRRRSTKTRRRRAPPEAPHPQRTASKDHNRLSTVSLRSSSEREEEKELPETPRSMGVHIDDAFERYEQYRQRQGHQNYRLSVSSFDTSFTGPPSPGSGSGFGVGGGGGSLVPPALSTTSSRETRDDREPSTSSSSLGQGGTGIGSGEGRSYSHIFNFLSRSKTPTLDREREPERPRLQISAPIRNNSDKSLNEQGGEEKDGSSSGAAFGTSWASLLSQDTLEGIPARERKRQEAIFELINTEAAYVRNLQLIVEVYYSSMIALLSEKEVTVVFANIEDLLLVNTTFLSSLEERQKDCRLYIDNVGDLLQQYMSSMDVYSEYCINQGNAIKILQSIRDSRPDVARHLQLLRDDPAVRNLDLSSYLLEPMQRITRYPLLIRQVLNYTESDSDRTLIEQGLRSVEKVLTFINEAIREQEGRARLEAVSKNLYVGQGRLDLAKSTGYMGQRKLLREGTLSKWKSGRKLRVFLCNDMIVTTDEGVSRLYKMPIQLNQVEAKDLPGKDDLGFQLIFAYPRGGEAMAFRASSAKDCQSWVKDISRAAKKARDLERRAAKAALASKQHVQAQRQGSYPAP